MKKFCFFCGGHQDYMVLYPLGGDYTGDAQQCAMCVGMVGPNAAAIFEVTEHDPGCGNPELMPGVWFTGRWTTISKANLPNIYGERAAAVAQAGAGTLLHFRYRSHRLDIYQESFLQ